MSENTLPMWAWTRPHNWPRQPSRWSRCGLCGSPLSSEYWWCLRWVATQSITGPSAAAEPSAAKKARVRRCVLKLRWVSSRVNPARDPGADDHVEDRQLEQVLPDEQPVVPAQPHAQQHEDGRRSG